jgi:metal-responsive CopG/Arc/MetJ family transcriptional regulator
MKDRITITVDKELLAWLDSKIEERIFANRSHGVEFLLRQKIKQEKEGKHEQNP